jgi:hypothetical protein
MTETARRTLLSAAALAAVGTARPARAIEKALRGTGTVTGAQLEHVRAPAARPG